MSGTDVLIVGAGPAGSATALLLAREGFDVELLDRREFPRAKACGDCVSPGANTILRRLGVWADVMAAAPSRLAGWQLSASSGSGFSAAFGSGFSIALERAKLDAVLLEAAAHAGVRVRTGTHVSELLHESDGRVAGVVTAEGAHRARLTVGADGLRSRVARSLGAYRRSPRLRKYSLTAHVRGVPSAGNVGEMHVRPGACLGIAPVEQSADPLYNVTVVLESRVAHAAGPHAALRAALRGFPERDLSCLIGDQVEILASGPFDWPTREIVFAGAALVGDAAGYYDPFTGQGIYHALAGAELLAEHATTALRGKSVAADALRPYATRHRALVGPARRVQHAVEFVCARPFITNAVFAGLGRSGPLAQELIAVTGDLLPARDLLRPAILARLVTASLTSLVR